MQVAKRMQQQGAITNPQPAIIPPAANDSTLAPWWHTALLLAPILGFSLLGNIRPAQHTLSEHHAMRYVFTLVWEWVLAAIVVWGIHMRKGSLRQLLGERRPTLRDWRDDLILAAVFWIGASIVLAAVGITLKLAHLSSPQKTIAQLAPQDTWQLVLWVLLSISAGICEELVFRGYLLQQFSRACRNVWAGVLISSLFFGIAHGYEGVSGMIAISIYGAMFCLLALKRGSLRTGMIAHAWHDIFSGIALMLLKHTHVL
jgi:membrane protease YdiL (CAAX protease family)